MPPNIIFVIVIVRMTVLSTRRGANYNHSPWLPVAPTTMNVPMDTVVVVKTRLSCRPPSVNRLTCYRSVPSVMSAQTASQVLATTEYA